MTLGHFDSAGNYLTALDTDEQGEAIFLAMVWGGRKFSEFIPYGHTAFASIFQGTYKETIAFLTERARAATARASSRKMTAADWEKLLGKTD